MTLRLLYIADPMCSWCYGFAGELAKLEFAFGGRLELRYVMGGLAPDTDEPMPEATRQMVQQAWRDVAARTGAEFNHEFWARCAPRRSTYPACRAVIAAGLQRDEARPAMFAALQRAYYREAKNPSEVATLIDVAGSLDPALDLEQFGRDLGSGAVEEALRAEIAEARRCAVTGFPSLVREGEPPLVISRGFVEAGELLARLRGAP